MKRSLIIIFCFTLFFENCNSLLSTPIADFDLSNKGFLVGYIGPDNDDLHFTPLRFSGNKEYENNEPDTYGLVIIANEIRTIFERNK